MLKYKYKVVSYFENERFAPLCDVCKQIRLKKDVRAIVELQPITLRDYQSTARAYMCQNHLDGLKASKWLELEEA